MPPTLPTLDEMRVVLRAGMTRDEFFFALDDLAGRPGGLRFGAPLANDKLISIGRLAGAPGPAEARALRRAAAAAS